MRQERLAGRGQCGALSVAFEQRQAQILLEAADLLGHRGLGDEQALGGPGEVQLLGDGLEVPQRTQMNVHARML